MVIGSTETVEPVAPMGEPRLEFDGVYGMVYVTVVAVGIGNAVVLNPPMGDPREELAVGAIGLTTTVDVLEIVTVDPPVPFPGGPYEGGGP